MHSTESSAVCSQFISSFLIPLLPIKYILYVFFFFLSCLLNTRLQMQTAEFSLSIIFFKQHNSNRLL